MMMTVLHKQEGRQEAGEDLLDRALLRYPLKERDAWRAEVLRPCRLVSNYARIRPKRKLNPETGKYEFTPEVRRLCEEARCTEPVILLREPHRARPVSPHTLDDWLRAWEEKGPAVLLRKPHSQPSP